MRHFIGKNKGKIMRNPGGYALLTGPEQFKESDTFTCVHCNGIVFVTPLTNPADLGGWCGCCAKPICKKCTGKPCVPFLKKLDAMESRERMLKNIGV
jgi:hypothetical protein